MWTTDMRVTGSSPVEVLKSWRQWLHSSVGRASHRYREVMGSSPVEVLIFFRLLYAIAKIAIITARIILHLISYPQFTYDLFHMHHSPSYLSREHMNPKLTCSQRQWLHSSVGRASHRYREVMGSSPVEVLIFCQASLRNCKNCSYDRNFCNCVKKPEKNQDFNGAWTHDLAIPVRRSTNWAMKPLTLGAGQFWVHMFPWKIWRWMMHMK